MIFTRAGQWYELSTCGRYTVAKARNADMYTYCAYRIVPGEPGELIECCSDPESAREACRKHAGIPETDFAACGGLEVVR